MDIIPQINKIISVPWQMEIYPYLRDHRFEGKVILPAVEALIIMANAVKLKFPQTQITCLLRARFSRFLLIAPETNQQAISVDIENSGEGSIAAVLLTSTKSKKGAISRTLEHAHVEFGKADLSSRAMPPFRAVEKLEGQCISIPSATIYRELVPFGKAYQNIVGDLSVSPAGALAYLSGGNYEADENLLGSPFVLDAAMHAACVWGQRFTDIVPFPVGFEKRVIYQKTRKEGSYLGRIVPVDVKKEPLIFDVWIYDLNSAICEIITGMQMRDVTQGRLRPPQWIK
jgi:hypothetical protein